MPRTPAWEGPGGAHVLVVDDERGVRLLVVRLLAAQGYIVHEAEDGRQAVARIDGSDPPVDLVVSDVMMPGMSGVTLAREIESRWPNVRLLLMSGHPPGGGACVESLLSRINFVSKPFTIKRLTDAVRDALDAPRQRPAAADTAR